MMKMDYQVGDKVRLTKIGKEVTCFDNPEEVFIVTKMETPTDFRITNFNEPVFQFVNPEDVYKLNEAGPLDDLDEKSLDEILESQTFKDELEELSIGYTDNLDRESIIDSGRYPEGIILRGGK